MVGINQFGQLAETRVDEKAVGLGQPAHVPQRVHLIRIIEPAAHKAERTVDIEIVARRIVVVQIDGDRYPIGPAGNLLLLESVGLSRRIGLRRIDNPDRHLRQSVAVGIVEQERILPVQPQVFHLIGRRMYLDKGRLPAVIGIKIRDAVLLPAFEQHRVPVDIVEHPVAVGIQHDHVVPVRPSPRDALFRILGDQLQVGPAVAVQVGILDDQVVNAVLVAVDQQAVVVEIAFEVAFPHIAVVIEPQHGNIVPRDAADRIRLPVPVQIEVLRHKTRRRRGQSERTDLQLSVPIVG